MRAEVGEEEERSGRVQREARGEGGKGMVMLSGLSVGRREARSGWVSVAGGVAEVEGGIGEVSLIVGVTVVVCEMRKLTGDVDGVVARWEREYGYESDEENGVEARNAWYVVTVGNGTGVLSSW